MSSIRWNRTSKGENHIEILVVTQDKNLRCIAILTSQRMIVSLGNSPYIQKKNVKVLSLGRFNWVVREMLPVSLWKFSFAPISKSLLFELFSVAASVCQCFMNMWNIMQSNLTTLVDNLIKLKQWLDKLTMKKNYKNNDQKIKCYIFETNILFPHYTVSNNIEKQQVEVYFIFITNVRL